MIAKHQKRAATQTSPSKEGIWHRMPDWTAETPLRVVTGYHNIAKRFFEREGFRHVTLLSADGALEAAPLMGCADIILDLVRSTCSYLASRSGPGTSSPSSVACALARSQKYSSWLLWAAVGCMSAVYVCL